MHKEEFFTNIAHVLLAGPHRISLGILYHEFEELHDIILPMRVLAKPKNRAGSFIHAKRYNVRNCGPDIMNPKNCMNHPAHARLAGPKNRAGDSEKSRWTKKGRFSQISLEMKAFWENPPRYLRRKPPRKRLCPIAHKTFFFTGNYLQKEV
jgi:hypothetical protein